MELLTKIVTKNTLTSFYSLEIHSRACFPSYSNIQLKLKVLNLFENN